VAQALQNNTAMTPEVGFRRLGEARMRRTASARWCGDLTTGKGSISTESSALHHFPSSFLARFDGGKGTNPEELLAASHAGCFTMALSAELGKANLVAESVRTAVMVTLDRLDGAWSITESHMVVTAKVPGASPELFQKAVRAAQTDCALSKLFNTKITMSARLEE
jgi:lipoyl-dependent peroxiredoxin